MLRNPSALWGMAAFLCKNRMPEPDLMRCGAQSRYALLSIWGRCETKWGKIDLEKCALVIP